MNARRLLVVGLVVASTGVAWAQGRETAPAAAPTALPLEALADLLGTWDAQGGGAPGKGDGTVVFAAELGGHAVVRRNSVSYPAPDGGPGTTHEDLLVLFAEGPRTKALYVDGEGHVIRYAVATPAAARTLVLVSEPGPGPQFRLTHDWSTPGTLRIVFAIAPPGSTEFKTYAAGTATRRRAP